MAECKYRADLSKQLTAKKKQLAELYEKRKDLATCKETWWQVESGINSLTVDIATIKSRIANYGKAGINLPDSNSNSISNLLNNK